MFPVEREYRRVARAYGRSALQLLDLARPANMVGDQYIPEIVKNVRGAARYALRAMRLQEQRERGESIFGWERTK